MPSEIVNEDKTNVGERPFFEELLGKKQGSGGLLPEKFLETMPLRRRKIPLLTRPPEMQIVSQFLAFSDNNHLSLEGNRALSPWLRHWA